MRAKKYLAQVAAQGSLQLVIPPEGTRSATREWKTGFYHIARGAVVPLILSVLDYGTKTVSLTAIVHPSGDYEGDLALIRTYYAQAVGKHPEKFTAA